MFSSLIFYALEPITAIKPLRLSELTGSIERMFKKYFDEKFYWVIADITSHNYYPNKEHHYFTLVEKKEETNEVLATIQTVAWKSGAARIRNFENITGQKFQNSINVLLKVSVEYHSRYGLKLILHDINTEFTLGKLEQERLATLKRILEECPDIVQKIGEEYKTSNKKLSHSAVIQKIALVGSSASAGYQDFVHTISNNPFSYKFEVDSYFGTVQGEQNAGILSSRLNEICNGQKKYDAVVIVRGGGADTDFLIFNQFELCKQIAAFPIPIITGLGHQKNESIVDLFAHTNTKTPTKAAEYIIAHNRRFEDLLIDSRNRIIIKSQSLLKIRQDKLSTANNFITNRVRDIISRHTQFLTNANTIVVNRSKDIISRLKEANSSFNQILVSKTSNILFTKKTDLVTLSYQIANRPKSMTEMKLNDLKNISANLKSFLNKYIVNKRGYIGHFESMIKAYSPVNILKKGFAIIYQGDKIITHGKQVKDNDDIKVRLTDYEITATAKSKKQIDGNNEFNI